VSGATLFSEQREHEKKTGGMVVCLTAGGRKSGVERTQACWAVKDWQILVRREGYGGGEEDHRTHSAIRYVGVVQEHG
jgi:hypothetical protein